MSDLPVSAVLPDLLGGAERGLPQILLAALRARANRPGAAAAVTAGGAAGRIIMLEPRRLAARNVAQRLAEQLGEQPGATNGSGCAAKAASALRPGWKWSRKGCSRGCCSRIRCWRAVSLVILDEIS